MIRKGKKRKLKQDEGEKKKQELNRGDKVKELLVSCLSRKYLLPPFPCVLMSNWK